MPDVGGSLGVAVATFGFWVLRFMVCSAGFGLPFDAVTTIAWTLPNCHRPNSSAETLAMS
jgi:hypothetical protein